MLDIKSPIKAALEPSLDIQNKVRKILISLLESRNINEAELSRRTGISTATVNRLITGATPDMRISTLRAIADFFNISLDQLTGTKPLLSESIDKKVIKFPLIPWDKAGEWQELIKDYTPENWSYWTTVSSEINKPYYGLTMLQQGFPLPFVQNAVLIIDPYMSPKDNQYVIVHCLKKGAVVIKKILFEGDEAWLISLRKNIPAIPYKGFRFCGVVVQVNLPLV